jgi:hypothetical protein
MRVLLARWRLRRTCLPAIVVERDLLVELWPGGAGSWVIPRRRIADGAACAADGAGTDSAERKRGDGPKH